MEAVPWSLQRRAYSLLANWNSQSAPTQTDRTAYEIAASEYNAVRTQIRSLEQAIAELESRMDEAGAPWSHGRGVQ